MAATLSLSGAVVAAQDITEHLEDLGSHSAIKKRGISDFHFWRGDLWVFSAAESSNTPILRFTPGTDTWRKDQDKNLDAEKVRTVRVHQGDLILSTEDELGNDNGTSGFLRTDRQWHRFNAGRANAHQQGQDRFGKRWFAGSYDNANPDSAPWMRWSDDLGKTQTKAPKGSLTLNETFKKGGLISRFFEFDGEFFANSFQDGLNVLHYTGRDDDPFEMTYENRTEWVPNSRYSTVFKSGNLKAICLGLWEAWALGQRTVGRQ